MKIGYARVSTTEQNLALQHDALKAEGCDHIYSDHGKSGSLRSRPELDKALAAVGKGDKLIVWKLDRLGRSQKNLVDILCDLKERGADVKAIQDGIDTQNKMGKALFGMVSVFSEIEADAISDRVRAGMAAAKRQGQHVGRPPKLSKMQVEYALDRKEQGEAISSIAKSLKVSRPTLYDYMNAYENPARQKKTSNEL